MNPYKCKSHDLENELCLDCFRAMKRRHDRMMNFIKMIEADGECYSSHDLIPLCHSEDAQELLKEIGEIE